MSIIITKNSATSGSIPASLVQGELAINVTNGKLFYGSGSGNIVKEFTGSASGGGTINTGSLLTTASFSNPNLTFTKGDGSNFNVNLVSLVPTSASFASTASFAPNYVLNSATSSFVQNSQTSSFVLNSQTSSMSVASASFASTASFAPNYVLNSATSSFVTNAQTSSMSVASASFALTASYYNETDPVFVAKSASLATTGSNTFNGSQVINGNLTVNGTASIAFLNVTYESASVIYSSGSNQFGDASNDTQTLWGTVDIKSGPVLVTGSLNVSGGITGSLLGTASFATTASYVTLAQSASYVSSNFQYEVHVSQIDGNDITGDGSLLKPVASITKALTLVGGSRRIIIVHPGGYTENPTINTTNITISTSELTGGGTVLYGTLTIPTSGSFSRISGFSMDNLAITETAQAYVSNCTVNNNVVKSSSGYVEIINSELQCISGIQISGAGITIINGNKNVGVAVSNASAQVIIKGCNSVVTPSASAGNLAIVDCIVTALGGNGITITGASTTLTLANSQVLVQAGNNVAPISVAGIYSIINTIYDKPGSTITGTSTNSVDYFQYIDADNITTKGLTVTGSITVSGSVINNLTSSYAISASNSISGSYALTASYALNALSASYTQTASYVQNAVSASYALNGGVTQLLAGPNVTLSPTNGLGQVTVSATLSGSTIFNTATGSYGSFYDTTTQTNPVANIARSMSFNSTDITNGVSISGSTSPFNTYIKTTNAGVYDIQFSAQVDKTDGGTDDIVIWLRKNGIDLTDTATTLTLPTNNSKVVAAWNWFVISAANDYYQIIWRSADTDLRLLAEPISVDHPGIPSVIATVNRVDQFLSNTGSFSGSFTGEFTGSLQGTSSWANNAITASYVLNAVSSSFASTASFVQNAQTASYVLNAVSASFASTASYVLNAVSSSFATSASFASTVPASGVIGLNLSQIATGSVTASVSPTQFTVTSGSSTELVVSGTGVTIGNATTDTHTVTGSFNVSGSARIVGNAQITGSLNVNAENTNISFYNTAGTQFIGSIGRNNSAGLEMASALADLRLSVGASAGNIVLDSTSRPASLIRLVSTSGTVVSSSFTVFTGSAVEFQVTNTGVKIGNAITDTHTVTGSLNISGSVTATSFTGSLRGTASYALNALTASYALTSGGGGGGVSFVGGTNVDNRIITATGATPELDGEVNLTFDGSILSVTGSVIANSFTGSLEGTASYATTSQLTNNAYFAQGVLFGTQGIPDSLDTIIQFVDQFDPQGWYDPGTYKFLPNIAGYYTVSLGVTLENTFNNTGYVQIQILKNGSTREMQCRQPLNTISDSSLFGSRIIYLDGNTDYLEFIVYQSSGGTFNILEGPGGQSPDTWFSATYMTM